MDLNGVKAEKISCASSVDAKSHPMAGHDLPRTGNPKLKYAKLHARQEIIHV